MPVPPDLEHLGGRFITCTGTTQLLRYATEDELAKLPGRRATVTGANVGIGFEIALALAKAGCHVVLACRNLEKAETAAAAIRGQVSKEVRVEVLQLDLASLKSVRSFAERQQNVCDILVHNAGIVPSSHVVTEDGYERGLQVNCLAPYLLTVLLLPALRQSTGPRVVWIASETGIRAEPDCTFDNMQMEDLPSNWGMFPLRAYRGNKAYMRSKFWQMASVAVLADHLRQAKDSRLQQVVCTLAHPGFCATELINKEDYQLPAPLLKLMGRIAKRFAQTAAQGAQTAIWLSTTEEHGHPRYSGTLWAACRQFALPGKCYDEQWKVKAWAKLCSLAGLPEDCV